MSDLHTKTLKFHGGDVPSTPKKKIKRIPVRKPTKKSSSVAPDKNQKPSKNP